MIMLITGIPYAVPIYQMGEEVCRFLSVNLVQWSPVLAGSSASQSS